MEQLLIRNIDKRLKLSIKKTAERNGRSMQAEVLDTLKREYGTGDADLMDIFGRIRDDLDGTSLEVPERSPARTAPDFE